MALKNFLSVSLLMCFLWICACAVLAEGFIAHYETYKPKPVLYSDGKTLAEVEFDDSGEMIHCRLHEMEKSSSLISSSYSQLEKKKVLILKKKCGGMKKREPSNAEPIIKGSGLQVKYPNFKEMLQLINECTLLEKPVANSIDNNNHTTSTLEAISNWSLWNGILPGTKWCGVGDIADSFEELGTQIEVDACCRAHDHCPVKLKAFRTGYGIMNLSLYTKSHCDCDKEFYSCLKTSRNKVSDVVGNLYFNVMKIQCIKEHRPFVCIENRTEIDGTEQCIKWGADPESKKMQTSVTHLKY